MERPDTHAFVSKVCGYIRIRQDTSGYILKPYVDTSWIHPMMQTLHNNFANVLSDVPRGFSCLWSSFCIFAVRMRLWVCGVVSSEPFVLRSLTCIFGFTFTCALACACTCKFTFSSAYIDVHAYVHKYTTMKIQVKTYVCRRIFQYHLPCPTFCPALGDSVRDEKFGQVSWMNFSTALLPP